MARSYFKEAHNAYTSQPHYKPELARHHFVRSLVARSCGDDVEAEGFLRKAEALYEDIVPHTDRESLSLAVLNGIVAPWVW